MDNAYQEHAKVFKALCDPKRLAILSLLRGGEKCACVLMDQLGMAQSAVSYHMKILCESGIVVSRQEGKWTHYSLSSTGSKAAAELLLSLKRPASNRIVAVDEKSHCPGMASPSTQHIKFF